MKQNWQNKTVFTGDNLPIMLNMNSDSVDLIYLDPPFNSNKSFSAPIGSKAAGASFDDAWKLKDIDQIEYGLLDEKYELLGKKLKAVIYAAKQSHSDGMFSYLLFMTVRLIECHRILKPTGSLYLHCDPYASHYLKQIMDCIFGQKNFRNEIVWGYGAGGVPNKDFGRKHDIILRYSKTNDYIFNTKDSTLRAPFAKSTLDMRFKYKDETGRRFRRQVKNGKEYFTYEDMGKVVNSVWTDIPGQAATSPISKESTGYPTQKPLKLLERIIKASAPPPVELSLIRSVVAPPRLWRQICLDISGSVSTFPKKLSNWLKIVLKDIKECLKRSIMKPIYRNVLIWSPN